MNVSSANFHIETMSDRGVVMQVRKLGQYVPHLTLAFILLSAIIYCSVFSVMWGQIAHAATSMAREMRKIRREYASRNDGEEETLFPTNFTTYEDITNVTLGQSLGDY